MAAQDPKAGEAPEPLGSSETVLAASAKPAHTYTERGHGGRESIAGSETLLAPSQPNTRLGVSSHATTKDERPSQSVSVDGATAYALDRPSVPRGATTEGDPLVGRRIDHFEVRAKLGEGGMGAVYLAHDISLERPVAIKVLRRELADDESLIDRLILEARAQARLQHPNVVTIYYIGSYEGAPYFAMEFVRGRSLEEHLAAAGSVPWQEALEYVIQAARALSVAYKRGIVHRDVKPSNLILADDRGGARHEVMVADFGLATPIGGREGSFAGSPHYASPEQIEGGTLDHRSDIYALGVTFHQILTGSRPFDATTITELFTKHRTAPRPPIPEDRAPWRLRRLVAEMMDPAPAVRPATYEDLISRLEALRPKETAAGGLMARGMALAVDLIVLAIFGQILAALAPISQVVAHQLGIAIFGVYYVGTQRRWQRTAGKQLFGLEVQSTQGKLTTQSLIVRFLTEFWGPILAVLMIGFQLGAATDLDAVKDQIQRRVGMSVPILDQSLEAVLKTVLVPNLFLALPWLGGFLLAVFDKKRLALHDRAARTRVVYRHKG